MSIYNPSNTSPRSGTNRSNGFTHGSSFLPGASGAANYAGGAIVKKETALAATATKLSKQTNESIKVCIRVRPLLPHEGAREEIVYYPDNASGSLQSIRIADGQHYIDSQYDRVFNQYAQQLQVFDFVRGKKTVALLISNF